MRLYFICVFIIYYCVLQGQKTLPDSVHINIIRHSDNDSLVGRAYVELAKLVYRRDPILCAAYLDSAKMIPAFMQHPESLASIKFTTGKLLRMQKKDLESIAVLNEALIAFKGLKNESMEQYTHYELASSYINTSDLENANSAFTECLRLAESLQDSSVIAGALNGLGVVQRKIGNLEKSLEYYSTAKKIYKNLDHIEGESTCLLNMAIIEKQLGQYESSLRLYNEALESAQDKEQPNTGLFSYIYGNMSSMYHSQDSFKQSIYYGEKALEIREKSASGLELSNAYVGLAANYHRVFEFEKAEQYLQKANAVAGANNEVLFIINKTYSDMEWRRKDYKKAYLYLNESMNFKDSIYNLEKTKQIDELNTRFETEKKESEIQRLELEDKLNEHQIKQQRLLLGVTGIAMSLLSFLLYRLFNQNKKINTQHTVITKALHEKEVLLKEIHHRVKNNLQVISSLLGIQSRAIKDEVAQEAIKESRARVHSMSLIHQDLYKHDNLTGIQVKSYLTKLCQDLFNTYDISEGRIKLSTDIDDIQLDVDTVIPIGLIVNELMTNSLKYAFPHERTGEVLVSLNLIDDILRLQVKDNGVGLLEKELSSKADSFGHKLIRAFKQKLNADVSIDNSNGTKISIQIQEFILQQ